MDKDFCVCEVKSSGQETYKMNLVLREVNILH
jgi:hypothetical protein